MSGSFSISNLAGQGQAGQADQSPPPSPDTSGSSGKPLTTLQAAAMRKHCSEVISQVRETIMFLEMRAVELQTGEFAANEIDRHQAQSPSTGKSSGRQYTRFDYLQDNVKSTVREVRDALDAFEYNACRFGLDGRAQERNRNIVEPTLRQLEEAFYEASGQAYGPIHQLHVENCLRWIHSDASRKQYAQQAANQYLNMAQAQAHVLAMAQQKPPAEVDAFRQKIYNEAAAQVQDPEFARNQLALLKAQRTGTVQVNTSAGPSSSDDDKEIASGSTSGSRKRAGEPM